MSDLRLRSDRTFAESPPLDMERGAVMAALLLFQVYIGDAKGDITTAEVFALLARDHFRCHTEVLFHYEDGACPKKSAVTDSTVLYCAVQSLSLAESCFLVITNLKPDRSFHTLLGDADRLSDVFP